MCSPPSPVACSPFRPQAFAPRMVRPRRDRAPRAGNRCDCRGLHGPRRDRVNVERPTLVRDPHRPIHALFHQHMGGPDRLVNLIESPLVRDGEVLAQASWSSSGTGCGPAPCARDGAMQISGLCWRHRNAPVVDRQIALQEPIRLLQGRDPRQPQLLDPPILKGPKEPLHPPLGLRGVGRDQLDSQLAQRSPTLTRGLHLRRVARPSGRRGGRLLGRRLVRIDGRRNPLPRHVALEAVHRRDRPFIS